VHVPLPRESLIHLAIVTVSLDAAELAAARLEAVEAAA
jgi:hypothetical protein